jgi:four helix bundle protein
MTMFDSLEVMLKVLVQLQPVEVKVRQRSLDLAKQIARAADSVALNLGEGRLRCDGDKRRHYEMAAGSASELTAALRVAVIRGYVDQPLVDAVEPLLDRVRAMLYKLTRPTRPPRA